MRSRDWTGGNDALSHSYDQDTAIYCRTTSIGCSVNQATSVQTAELHHMTSFICSLATHTRRTCHLRIHGGIRWDRFVRSATSTTLTLTNLRTDLVVENNNNIHDRNPSIDTRQHSPGPTGFVKPKPISQTPPTPLIPGLAKFDWKVVAHWATKYNNLVAQQWLVVAQQCKA